MSANWLKVPDNQVPTNPRPGTCFNDTKSLSDTYINFIKKHTLVDESVRRLLIVLSILPRKYPLRRYILGVLTHTTAWDRL